MLTDEQLKQLKAPFPDDAITEDISRGFQLHSVKAAYIIERLNDVFGVCGVGWRYVHSPVETTGKEVTTEVALQYSYGDARCGPIYWDGEINCWAILDTPTNWSEPVFAHGGKSKGGGSAPLTDAKKSAVTDGLTKAASMLGIAHHVFKGLGKQGVREQESEPAPEPKKPADLEKLQDGEFALTIEECKEKGFDIGGYAKYAIDLLKNVRHEGKPYYDNLKHRENLYEELFGETDFGEWVLGWFRLLESYAFYLVEPSDDEFEEAKEYAKKVVQLGVEKQVSWEEAVELMEEGNA